MYDYIKDPVKIEQESFKQIRQLSQLEQFDLQQQQVAMRLVHTLGQPEICSQIRFSENAIEAGLAAIKAGAKVISDVEMVRHGLTKRMLKQEALCFLNNEQTQQEAKAKGESRSMAAVSQWQADLAGAIVLIGNAPTALFRLLENIAAGGPKPALIIGMPVGFIGAAESKQALWDDHQKLGLECISLLGRQGGSAPTAAAFNALLRINLGEMY